jgi:hypothetical protein
LQFNTANLPIERYFAHVNFAKRAFELLRCKPSPNGLEEGHGYIDGALPWERNSHGSDGRFRNPNRIAIDAHWSGGRSRDETDPDSHNGQ